MKAFHNIRPGDVIIWEHRSGDELEIAVDQVIILDSGQLEVSGRDVQDNIIFNLYDRDYSDFLEIY